MLQEMTIDDFQAGDSPQSAQIKLLAIRLIGITGTGAYQSSEIFDFDDLVFRQKQLAQFLNIQLFVGCPFDCTIRVQRQVQRIQGQGGAYKS